MALDKQKRYRESHPERVKESQKRSREKMTEAAKAAVRESKRKSRAKNKERQNAARRKGGPPGRKPLPPEERKRRAKIQVQNWRDKNPEKARAIGRESVKRCYHRNKNQAAADQFFLMAGAAEQISKTLTEKQTNEKHTVTDRPE